MTAKDALNQIKALFADANVPEAPSAPATEQFKEYQLANGSTVMIDNLAVGGMVTVPGPEGNPIPAPVGDHILADGQVITLDEAGKITEIATPEVVEEVEDKMKKKIEAMESAIADIKADYSARFAAQADYSARFAAQADEFAAKTKAAEDKLTALKDVLVEFLSAPSADPIKPEQFRESKSDKVNRFLEFTKNMK